MSEITQEKAEEYRQVAGLLAMQIEVFAGVLEDESMTIEEIRGQVALHLEDMKKITTDKAEREMMWNATCTLMGGLHGWTPDNG